MNNENCNPSYDPSQLSQSFQALIGKTEKMLQLLDTFPMPIEVFDANGTAVFLNRACLDMNNIIDANRVVGKYNCLNDPVCDEILGHELLERAFRGEAVSYSDFTAPLQVLVDRRIAADRLFESAIMDVYFLPIWDGECLANVIRIFYPKRLYQGLPEVRKAKEHIDSHCLEEFDASAIARAVNISGRSLYNLFKQHVGMTPKEYYNKAKIDHIKERLADKSLTVTEAFSLCGANSRGEIAKTFKKLTGMTPTEYRNSLYWLKGAKATDSKALHRFDIIR